MKEKTVEKILDVEQEEELTIEVIKKFADDKSALQAYAKKKPEPYSGIVLTLMHRRYEETVARGLWNRLVSHMKDLERKLERRVGINVAAIDYLENMMPTDEAMGIIGQDALDNLAEMSTRDELTHLYTRDVFEFFINKCFEESIRNGACVAFALFDIDDFKNVNDTYGHQKGDEVLKDLSNIILKNIREMDVGVRYGGEELGVIFPNTDQDAAGVISERIREKIEVFFRGEMNITISCGVADSKGKKSVGDLVKGADTALYHAKESGKNQVYRAGTGYK